MPDQYHIGRTPFIPRTNTCVELPTIVLLGLRPRFRQENHFDLFIQLVEERYVLSSPNSPTAFIEKPDTLTALIVCRLVL